MDKITRSNLKNLSKLLAILNRITTLATEIEKDPIWVKIDGQVPKESGETLQTQEMDRSQSAQVAT